MDRQTLLEQKRQRLQELKLRRTGNAGSTQDDAQVAQLIEKLLSPSVVKMVSVAVQVDLTGTAGSSQQFERKIDPDKENLTYDKGVQATTEEIVETEADVAQPKERLEKETLTEVEFTDTYSLNAAIVKSIKLINKVHVSKLTNPVVIDTNAITDYSEKIDFKVRSGVTQNPFVKSGSISNVDRPVQCIAMSPHFSELTVVAFASKAGRNSSPGLAVIYSIKNNTLFPEYYLHCSTPITTIQFDSNASHKIIAGLADGKIVIWDLQNRQKSTVAVLPLLQTPLFSALSLADTNVQLQPHTMPVTSIIQLNVDGNDLIVSFSLDGVVNTWSTNLLATPKLETVRLFLPKRNNEFSNFRDPVRITSALLATERREDDNTTGSEHKFLNSIVVASESGRLFQLSNNPREEHIAKSTPQQELFDNLTDSVEINGLVLTSHLDWTLKLWLESLLEPLVTIPTKTPILRIARRPGAVNHIVTLGLANKSPAVVEFWDLENSLFKSILDIPIDVTVTSVAFGDMETLLLGHEDGTVSKWDINKDILAGITGPTNEGLHGYLKRRN